MEIEIDLTRDDYANFNRYWFLKRGLKRRVYLVIVMAFVLPFIANKDYPFEWLTYSISVVIYGIMFGVIYLGGMFVLMSRTRSLPSEAGSILGKKKFIISEEGLIEETENNRTFQKWSGIQSVESNSNSVFIFVDRIAAYILPKRYFKNAEAIANFIAEIETRRNKTQ